MDLSIVILNYKSRGLTLNCLKSVKEADLAGLEYEIIVMDNDSRDNLQDLLAWQYPEVKFIGNESNLGYGAANNLGLARAQGEYLVIMNPDTLAFPNTFRILYDYLQANPRVGIVGPRQFNPDRTIQDSCYRWHKPLTPFYRRTFLGQTKAGRRDLQRFLINDTDKEKIQEVNWLLGSFLMIRHSAWKEVGGFDERFYLYFEDTDLCRRFWQKNWRVVYNPLASIIHNHGRASARLPWYKFFTDRASRSHVASWLKYLLKWGLKEEKK